MLLQTHVLLCIIKIRNMAFCEPVGTDKKPQYLSRWKGVPPEVPLREVPYNAVVELVNPVADTVSRKTYTGADVDWYVKAEDIVLKNKGNQNAGSPQNHTPQGQPKK